MLCKCNYEKIKLYSQLDLSEERFIFKADVESVFIKCHYILEGYVVNTNVVHCSSLFYYDYHCYYYSIMSLNPFDIFVIHRLKACWYMLQSLVRACVLFYVLDGE